MIFAVAQQFPFSFKKRNRQFLLELMDNFKFSAVKLLVRADNFIPTNANTDSDKRYENKNSRLVAYVPAFNITQDADDCGIQAEEKFICLLSAVARGIEDMQVNAILFKIMRVENIRMIALMALNV